MRALQYKRSYNAGMKHASAEFIIWLIVAVVVMVAKGLGKLATPSETEKPASKDEWPGAAPRPKPKPVVRRPTRRPTAEAPPPVIAATPAVAEEKPAPPPPSAAVPPAPPSRSNQWAMALRDRQNIRNVIIANEIIGKPVALRDL